MPRGSARPAGGKADRPTGGPHQPGHRGNPLGGRRIGWARLLPQGRPRWAAGRGDRVACHAGACAVDGASIGPAGLVVLAVGDACAVDGVGWAGLLLSRLVLGLACAFRRCSDLC